MSLKWLRNIMIVNSAWAFSSAMRYQFITEDFLFETLHIIICAFSLAVAGWCEDFE